jgi:hypothetical protein
MIIVYYECYYNVIYIGQNNNETTVCMRAMQERTEVLAKDDEHRHSSPLLKGTPLLVVAAPGPFLH